MKRFVLSLALVACTTTNKDYPEPPLPPDGGPITESFPGGPSGPPPTFGATVSADKAPPPISGGTLLLTKDGAIAVAADPDRDAVYLVNLSPLSKTEIALRENDEPGRSVEDGNRRVHVVLRRGGAIATIDLETRKEIARRDVCAAPRGIAYDAGKDSLLVACAGGELVTLPAAGGAATRTVDLGRDLRDVIVVAGNVYVSRFRSARLIGLDADGKPISDAKPRNRIGKPQGPMSPSVSWRISPVAGAIVMVHQLGQDSEVGTTPGGYGGSGGCGSIVQTGVTTFNAGAPTTEPVALPMTTLPVDFATDSKGRIAVVSAGNTYNSLPQISIFDHPVGFCPSPVETISVAGEVTSAVFAGESLVVQSRQPAFVEVWTAGTSKRVVLSDVSRADTGHQVFHANSGSFISCASCHPEGGDDARTWSFAGLGPRRTQTFRGGLTGSEPFHWDGDMKDLSMLMSRVFEGRMSGPHLQADQLAALTKWIDKMPEIPKSPAKDDAAVARGLALFGNADVGCASCHSGARLSNNATVNVGTGLALQVPSLRGISYRGPFLHDGCASNLLERFTKCGGGDMHGKTSTLSAAQLTDLVAYLETL
jgi:mono/diheme cytochrome c family protein